MTISTADIQSLYIAYFNRPADPVGLQFYQTSPNLTIASIGAAFAASPEYTSVYAGKQPAEIVSIIYQNLFGRAPETTGLLFWADALNKGYVTTGNIAYQILQGAQNDDKIAITSKISAATAFTTSLDTSAEIVGYSGAAANAVASDWLKAITNPTNLAAATTADALLAVSTAATAAHDGQNNTGSSFATTVAIDTIVGTNGNDTINVYASGTKADGTDGATLSANDSIDGGAGIDTLNLEVGGTGGPFNATQVGTIKNVEIINISGADLLATGTIDASKYQGSTNINILSTSVAADVTVTGLSGKTLGVGAGFDGGKIVTGNFGTATSANVVLTNVADGITVNTAGAKVATLTVSGSSEADGDTITLTNTAAVTKLNLNLKTEAVVSVAGLTALTTIASTGIEAVDLSDAGASVQSVTTAGGADTIAVSFVTAKATSVAAAKNSTVSSGAGDDTISIGNTGDGMASVDAGSGDDTITATKTAGGALSILGGVGDDKVTIVGVLETTDVIDGGDGTDTVAVAGSTTARVADDFIVLNKVIKNFESLELTTVEGTVGAVGAAEVAMDASKLASTYTTVTFDGATSFVKSVAATQAIVQKGAALTVTAAGYIPTNTGTTASTTYAGTVNVTDKAAGASDLTVRADTVNLTVKGVTTHADVVATPVVATLHGDVKTAVITVNNGVDTDADDGSTLHDNMSSVSITTATTVSTFKGAVDAYTELAKLASLTLSGSGSATVVNAASTSLVTVDASGLGGTYTVTADGHTVGDLTNGLTYTSANSAAETIKLGSGIDTVTLNASVYGKVDSVAGLNLVLNTAGTALTASSDKLVVANATTATKVTTTQTDIDLALKDFAAAHVNGTVVFAFGGDTYVYHDMGVTAGVDQGKVDASDVLVKLVGTVNLDALIVSLG